MTRVKHTTRAAALLVLMTVIAGVLALGLHSPAPAVRLVGAVAPPSMDAPFGDSPALAEPATYTRAALADTAPLTADAPPWAAKLHPVATPAPSTQLEVALTLQGRDPVGEAKLAEAMYNRSSSSFHGYLTPADFAEYFGAEPARADAARAWLTAAGLRVTYSSSSGTVVQVRGTLAQLSSRFGVRFATFEAEGDRFISAIGAPVVPKLLGIRAIVGLDQYPYFTPLAFPSSASTTPPDLWNIYDQPANAVDGGQGQRLASISWGTPATVQSDLRTYETEFGLPQIPLTITQVGSAGTDATGITEWDLDVQAASSMAPNARSYDMYFATDSTTTSSAVQAWADDPNGSLQLSASYGGCEALNGLLGAMQSFDSAAEQATLEGRTVFVSSGDAGAGCGVGANTATNSPILDVEFPASSPWVVAVGGTVITTKDGTSPAQRDVEYAWTSSGGGISTMEPAPAWQAAAVPATPPCVLIQGSNPNTGALPCRAVPDVAAQSGDQLSGYKVIVGGQPSTVLGTSLSAPLWQGMWARVQAAAPLKGSVAAGLGFAAPALYALQRDPVTYAQSFTDITLGDNGPYPAGAGWDYVTGLGVPDVKGLLAHLDGAAWKLTDPTGQHAPTFTPPKPTLCPARVPQLVEGPGNTANLQGALGVPGPAVAPDDADLHLHQATYAYRRKSLTVTINVAALAADPRTASPGALGDQFQALFTMGGVNYVLVAARQTVDSTTPPNVSPSLTQVFQFGLQGAPGSFPTILTTVTGAFDTTASLITINLPESTFHTATTQASLNAPTLAGSLFTKLSVNSQYDDGQATFQADQLTASCAYKAPGKQTGGTTTTTTSASSSTTTTGGSTLCTGPLWTNPHATDSYPEVPGVGPTGVLSGQNPQLALTEGDMGMSADGSALVTALKVAQFPSTVPPGGLAIDYYTDWTYKGTSYWSDGEVDALGNHTFSDGTIGTGRTTTASGLKGSITKTPDGGAIIEVTVPLKDVGSPPAGGSLGTPAGLSTVEIGVPSSLGLPTSGGLLITGDQGGPGQAYAVGEACGVGTSIATAGGSTTTTATGPTSTTSTSSTSTSTSTTSSTTTPTSLLPGV